MGKFDTGVVEVATSMCREQHGLRVPCVGCLITAVRADERMVAESEQRPPALPYRVAAARRMRAAGARVTHLMSHFGISYAELWSWLHTDPIATDARSAAPAPMFLAVA